jgi:hypothetical protein
VHRVADNRTLCSFIILLLFCRSALTFPPCCLLALHGSFLSQSHPSSKTPASHSRNFFFLCRKNAETFHLLALHGSLLSQSYPSSKAPTLHSRNLFFLYQMHVATSHPQQQQQQQEKGTRGLFGSYETWSPEMPLLSLPLSSGTEQVSPQKIERFPPTLIGFSSHCLQCSSDIYL